MQKRIHYFFVTTLTLLVPFLGAAAQQRASSRVINPKKPSIYLQFESFDSGLGRVRIQFKNNTKFTLLLQQRGTYVDSENEVNYGIEQTTFINTCICNDHENCRGDHEDDLTLPPPPKLEETDFGQSYLVAPGGSESFSVPERYFVSNADVYVVFTYEWERNPNEPKHRVYFHYCALPVHVQKQIRQDAVYMDGLIAAKAHGFVYSENEASPLPKIGNSMRAVRILIHLGDKAIPLLIHHLDDTRPTAATYCCISESEPVIRITRTGAETPASQDVFTKKRRIPVPVGYLALEILAAIVDTGGRISDDCVKTVQRNCAEGKYYFRPDEVASYDAKKVKDSWREAYSKGLLKFRLPNWWSDK